jgi:hypothetical protein
MMKKLLFVTSLIILIFIFVSPVLAQGPDVDLDEAGRVVFGSDLVLEEGEFVEGDVVVFGGNFEMKEGSEVKGDVVVFGGKVSINGEVKGDVAGIGGEVEIDDNAVIKGDVSSLGGEIDIDEDAEISGIITEGPNFEFDSGEFPFQPPEPPQPPELPEIVPPSVDPGDIRPSRPSFVAKVGDFVGDGITNIFWALIFGGLSMLLVLFFPVHIKTVQDTLVEGAPVSFLVGIITVPAAVAVIVLLALFSWLIIPACGIIVVVAALFVALLVGWAVVGKLIGVRIFATFDNPSPSDASATLVGVVAFILVASMPFLDHLPWFGWMFGLVGALVGLLVSAAGLGAVVLSRFGTQTYQSSSGMALLNSTDTSEEPDVVQPDSPESTETSTPTDTPDSADEPDVTNDTD